MARRAQPLFTALLVAWGSPPSPEPARATTPLATSASASAAAPTQPAPPTLPHEVAGAQPGPLYLAVRGIGILEVEADASRVIYATKEKAVALAVDPDGGVWASFYEDGTVYVADLANGAVPALRRAVPRER